MGIHVKLRNLRLEQGLSVKEVAQKLELTSSAITHYEKGDRKVPYDILRSMAKLYKTSADDILGIDSELDLELLANSKKRLHLNGVEVSEKEEKMFRDLLKVFIKNIHEEPGETKKNGSE